MKQERVLSLEPCADEQWDAEAVIYRQLDGELERVGADEALRWLDQVTLKLPERVEHTELVAYAAARATPLDVSVTPDAEHFDFHFVELPLNILVPAKGVDDGRRLVRLRMTAAMDAGGDPATATAHDLFPRDDYSKVTTEIGDISIDVGKALTFVVPAIADVLGLSLKVPLKWKSTRVLVRCSDRDSNPVEWDVTDESIDHGFTGYLIAKIPKGAPFAIDVRVTCEFRKQTLLGRLQHATFRSGAVHYDLTLK